MANTNNKTDWSKKEVGALWSRQSKTSNEKYLNGTLKFNVDIKAGQEVPVIVFSNKTKKAENQPDLRVFLSDKPTGSTQNQSPKTNKTEQTSTTAEEALF